MALKLLRGGGGGEVRCRSWWHLRALLFIQVISHQVITGEQGEKYCETLPAPFERHDSAEFSGGVPIEKTNIDMQS